ncbi:MAG: tRNA uridine(34) 5-carboxymethylaminomethyl modification radical SAM/GNAT enzyme Elp3 [archaeon]
MVQLKKAAFRKPSKTIAGVTPVAVMLKPRKCKHGTCLYCPSLDVPQSYTPRSPAVLRAKMFGYDAFKQVESRLKAFEIMSHPTDKIELIVMGGTFSDYPLAYQKNFIKKCYDALNGRISSSLEQAKKLNEKAKHRCVALCIETRPDLCSEKEIQRMLELGATRVELGVQAIDDRIYRIVERKHTVEDVVKATQLLRDAGFKIGYHIMPGLPGSSLKHDLEMFKQLFSDSRFKPEQLKIYPCQVIRGSKLEKWFEKGKYNPYSESEIVDLIVEMLRQVPEYCRVMRIMREIPPEYLVAGTQRIDLRKVIDEKLAEKKIKLKEIRSREIGFMMREHRKIDRNLKLKVLEYSASNGREFFLEVVNKQNFLFGLLRLRIPFKPFIQELDDAAIVRELHVYGKSISLGKKSSAKKFDAVQHKGLGKMLMRKAEEIAKKQHMKKIAVISGVGVREYYGKLGYHLEGGYMVKNIR